MDIPRTIAGIIQDDELLALLKNAPQSSTIIKIQHQVASEDLINTQDEFRHFRETNDVIYGDIVSGNAIIDAGRAGAIIKALEMKRVESARIDRPIELQESVSR